MYVLKKSCVQLGRIELVKKDSLNRPLDKDTKQGDRDIFKRNKLTLIQNQKKIWTIETSLTGINYPGTLPTQIRTIDTSLTGINHLVIQQDTDKDYRNLPERYKPPSDTTRYR